jgi:hypothetical protein
VSGIDLWPGEEAHLAADKVTLLAHAPTNLVNEWHEPEAPRTQPKQGPKFGQWEDMGPGRLVLTSHRLHWEGKQPLDFCWPEVSAVLSFPPETLVINYGAAPYRLMVKGELIRKWLAYAAVFAQQAAAASGKTITVTRF